MGSDDGNDDDRILFDWLTACQRLHSMNDHVIWVFGCQSISLDFPKDVPVWLVDAQPGHYKEEDIPICPGAHWLTGSCLTGSCLMGAEGVNF